MNAYWIWNWKFTASNLLQVSINTVGQFISYELSEAQKKITDCIAGISFLSPSTMSSSILMRHIFLYVVSKWNMWFYTHQLQHTVLLLFTLQFPWIVLTPGIPAKEWINYSETPQKPLMVIIVIHSGRSRVFIYPFFFLCWNKAVGDNLGDEHGANQAAWCPALPLYLPSFPSSICSPSPCPNPFPPIHQLQGISSGRGGGGVSGWWQGPGGLGYVC